MRDHGQLFAHPLRRRIWALLADEDGPSSPKGIAAALGAPLATVAYHVRQLADAGVIELARTRQRRGALEHYYRVVTTPTQAAEQLAELAAGAPA
jgi:DNA-binding transcriptional ArsR family regulator